MSGNQARRARLRPANQEPVRSVGNRCTRGRAGAARVARSVVAKAEHIRKKDNPRFIVNTLSPWEHERQTLYE